MADIVSDSELATALDNLAWKLAQEVADALPPYLQDDELTVQRFADRNKDKMTPNEARALLDALVEGGKLEKQERRQKGKSGSHVIVFVTVEKKGSINAS